MRPTEIESLAELDDVLARGAPSLRGFHLQSLDLTGHAAALAARDVRSCVFLGCRFVAGDGPGSEADVRRRGGLVFPTVPDVPFDPYRGLLYSPAELYAGIEAGYAATPDATAYAWSRGARSLDKALAVALHDHAIDDALGEFTAGRTLVGIMGGHATPRGTADYLTAARLGRRLATRFTVATGGGPGAMEAANLGAWMATTEEAALDEAAAMLSSAAGFDADVTAWVSAAFAVRERWPNGAESLGVPTWFYGHEPPNVFASAIAKYFRNAIREDMLLHLCRGGIVFLPGSAGTLQELFQASCGNYYAEPAHVVPLVLVGRDHWTHRLPAWPLLQVLARGQVFAARLHLVDRPEEVLPLLVEEGRGGG